jgi:hypothetical protein
MLPEDYGALYLQWAFAIHRVDPQAKLGGPVFTGVNEDILAWPNGEGKVSWTRRFVDYLREHGRLQDLAFFSFEHYPYEPCKVSWASLYDEPRLVRHIMQVWREDGVPSEVPLFITESNISWNTGESFVDIFGALWLAEYVGAFFDAGGNALYYFHDLPLGLYAGCNESMGTFGLFTSKNYDLGQPTSQYFASQLINLEWVEPGNGVHRSYPAQSDLADAAGHKLVSAYALSRPDKKWSLMLVNRDQENDRRVRVVFTADGAQERYFAGPVDRVTFGAAQYQWHPTEKGGFAQPDGPAVKTSITADENTLYVLPKASITILRGSLNQPR